MPIPLLALAISAFAIGTTEFVIMGLLPDVAKDLAVSLPSAALLVSGYALGVAVGAPLLAVVTSKMPRKLALRYAVLPVAIDGNTLVLASEQQISQVSIGAISRQLKRPVRGRLAPQGRVTLGLRHWYGGRHQTEETRAIIDVLRQRQGDEALMERLSGHVVMFGSLLQVRGMVPPSLFNQALIDFDPEQDSLGEHLIKRGMITQQVLEEALQEQASEQHEAYRIVREAV